MTRTSIRTAAPLLAAVALTAAAPAAQAQLFGLQPDGPAPAKKTGRIGRMFGLGPDSGVVPAGGPVAAGPVLPAAACVPAPSPAAGHGFGGGLVPDDGRIPGAAPEPIYPPGTRQKRVGGLLWPPFPRPVAPKASVATQLHHAHYWPLPYVCRDRASVRAFSAAQIAAGRAELAVLHGFHFDPTSHALTGAGRDHLRSAVLAAATAGSVSPIVVAVGEDWEVGQARLVRVQAEVARMGAPQLAAAVRLGRRPTHGRPAEEIDRLRLDELQSTPQPRIPVQAAGAAAATGI